MHGLRGTLSKAFSKKLFVREDKEEQEVDRKKKSNKPQITISSTDTDQLSIFNTLTRARTRSLLSSAKSSKKGMTRSPSYEPRILLSTYLISKNLARQSLNRPPVDT